jgi:hypothetical protein
MQGTSKRFDNTSKKKYNWSVNYKMVYPKTMTHLGYGCNFGKLRFKTESEQQIWNDCGRLIANCIIFFNALILSNVLRRQAEKRDSMAAGSLASVSPVAWQHINFYGRYEFTKSFQPIDIDAIVQELVSRSGSTPSVG